MTLARGSMPLAPGLETFECDDHLARRFWCCGRNERVYALSGSFKHALGCINQHEGVMHSCAPPT